MAQYISKTALVAEIERRTDELYNFPDASKVENGMITISESCNIGKYTALESFKDYIDTLEVKDDNLLTEKKIEKELAEDYISIFDKKFGNKLPKLKGKQLADFKNFINTCEQTFHIKYFDYHATQGKLFEKLALLWAVWGKEHLSREAKEVDLQSEIESYWKQCDMTWCKDAYSMTHIRSMLSDIAKHFFELGMCTANSLTVTDIEKIYHLVNEVSDDLGVMAMYVNIYQETLKRFKALKGE